jgi:hypothetical protein
MSVRIARPGIGGGSGGGIVGDAIWVRVVYEWLDDEAEREDGSSTNQSLYMYDLDSWLGYYYGSIVGRVFS